MELDFNLTHCMRCYTEFRGEVNKRVECEWCRYYICLECAVNYTTYYACKVFKPR